MRIQKRVVDGKRHTKGYIIDGKRYTRGQTVKLARAKKLEGVIARKGPYGWFVASSPASMWNLYDLNEVVEK